VSRDCFVSELARHPYPGAAGRAFWERAEPWLGALADLAQDPSVLLAELDRWLAALDRSRLVELKPRGYDTLVCLTPTSELADAPGEAEFVAGVVAALLNRVAGEARVVVDPVPASGAGKLALYVRDWIPVGDPRHQRAIREIGLLASNMPRQVAVLRRVEELEENAASRIDPRELRATRDFIDELDEIIVVFDAELGLLDANRAAQRFSGMGLHELRSRGPRDLLTVESYQRLQAVWEEVLEGGSVRDLRLEVSTREGRASIELSARLALEGAVVLCIARDVTERLRLERELEARTALLHAQNEQLTENDRLKSQFLANVTHELTTPLTSIRGFSRLIHTDLNREIKGETAQLEIARRVEFLEIVEREAARMTRMIHGVLELSLLESGGARLERGTGSPADLARACQDAIEARFEASGRRLEIALDTAVPEIPIDAARVRRAISELLENALKFSPAGSRSTLWVRREGVEVVVGVTSPCRDLDAADLERLFDRFVQNDGSYARRQGGVGLGLNLARAIAELHGGRASARLPDPNCVEFAIHLPVR
jgi:PAS domain S-box-containing protein